MGSLGRHLVGQHLLGRALMGAVIAAALVATPRATHAEPHTAMVPVRAELPPASRAARDLSSELAPEIAYGTWKGLTAGCSYIAPKADFVGPDGGIDVVFHFHAGQMAERQMKASGTNAVFVSCGFGLGTTPYAERFASPGAFGWMVDKLVKSVEADTRSATRVRLRHVVLASWSAGFAAVGKILAVPRYYEMVDAVVLNDSLHARYKGESKAAGQGWENVDVESMGTWLKLTNDAIRGKKAFVVTHTSILPPDYASSTEATAALMTAANVPLVDVPEDERPEPFCAVNAVRGRPMSLAVKADVGALHVRGYRGRGPKDHFDHLYLVGEALRSWVVRRWKREDRLVYTLAR